MSTVIEETIDVSTFKLDDEDLDENCAHLYMWLNLSTAACGISRQDDKHAPGCGSTPWKRGMRYCPQCATPICGFCLLLAKE